MKRNLEEEFPMIVVDLCTHLDDIPDSMLPNQIMHFGLGLRGTRLFWNKGRGEITNMIIQIGSPTFFFTLSATDTKWNDMHMVIPNAPPGFSGDVLMEIQKYNQQSTSCSAIHS